jgi:hypothetical protein
MKLRLFLWVNDDKLAFVLHRITVFREIVITKISCPRLVSRIVLPPYMIKQPESSGLSRLRQSHGYQEVLDQIGAARLP